MKGHTRVIKTLNDRLSEELAAISQYMVHAEMAANWGYHKLHEELEKTAHTEMHHAEVLIARVHPQRRRRTRGLGRSTARPNRADGFGELPDDESLVKVLVF